MFWTFAALLLTGVFARPNELKLQDPTLIGEVVISPLPRGLALPTNWDWRNVDGQNLVTADLNQHIPVYCGSCWAHASFSSIADRIKIATKGSQRDVIPSIQVLINCGDAGSCHGGDSNAANAWVYNNGGVPEWTCQQYKAINMDCTEQNTCMNCDPTRFGSGTCYPITQYDSITISEYGTVVGDADIMNEIYARGPVACYINADCLEEYTGGIASYAACEKTIPNHAIQLAGFGVDEATGSEYWIGRNSWGTYWGEHGWFKILKGSAEGAYNPEACYWTVPDVPDF